MVATAVITHLTDISEHGLRAGCGVPCESQGAKTDPDPV